MSKKKKTGHSPLQKLNSQTQWAVNFSLHRFNSYNIDSIPLSEKSKRLIAVRNFTMQQLRNSILADSAAEKDRLLALKKEFDDALP